jgi:hypothetical protein
MAQHQEPNAQNRPELHNVTQHIELEAPVSTLSVVVPADAPAPKARRSRKWLKHFSWAFALFIVALFAASKRPKVSGEDQVYLQRFLQEWNITSTAAQAHASFDSEIAFLSTVQKNIFQSIRHEKISPNDFGNVSYYFANRKGECYDRAVLMEKILISYGFEFRHVFIYYSPMRGTNETKGIDFFKPGTLSHAMTEVKTSKGWMAIESNTDCIGLGLDGNVLSVRAIERIMKEKGTIELKTPCTSGLPFWKKYPNFNYAYGVYSRHGMFLKPHLPVPGYNLRMLLYNIVD